VRIGPITITRRRKTPAGLKIYPWEAITTERVTPELRQVIAKVARSEVKSYLQQRAENAVEQCAGPHMCIDGYAAHCCEASCFACSRENVRPCYADHRQTKLKEAS
jgi:hypothetical protein